MPPFTSAILCLSPLHPCDSQIYTHLTFHHHFQAHSRGREVKGQYVRVNRDYAENVVCSSFGIRAVCGANNRPGAAQWGLDDKGPPERGLTKLTAECSDTIPGARGKSMFFFLFFFCSNDRGRLNHRNRRASIATSNLCRLYIIYQTKGRGRAYRPIDRNVIHVDYSRCQE